MEIGLNTHILSFFIENSFYLLASPISGSIHSIYCIFKEWQIKRGNNDSPVSNQTGEYEQFLKQLDLIQRLDSHAILREDKETISFINHENLQEIIDQSQGLRDLESKSDGKQLKSLNDLISTPFSTSDSKYEQLLSLLNYQNTGSYPAELTRCLEAKIHFIPVIKSHTDPSLGDCSYLDTCHKSDTCRYLHYLKHVPEDLIIEKTAQCDAFNANIPFWEKISPFDKNGSVSNISRDQLDSQWINCDVRTFDFSILGKFAAVIADPAWNIHMNLPYGTCNDTELLNLPLANIQDEGILMLWVTGRAIEIGKESLSKWGYTLKNELIWVKTNQLSRTICTGRTGHWLNHSKEHLLVGVKGNPQWLNKGIDVDVIVSPTRETSRKPDELYDMVERLVGPHARKLEIFGRDHNLRKGWFTIGNQLSGVNILEHDVLKRYNASNSRK
ncbi:hypothetical protein WICPIJ_005664 [Wickerhamomyces pijperi]|uniref:mRNA m(6)A methyltransferase n=1 Tax=Wickerhamomyces pijperi TaxID=599730 RepID=A0A9P8Q3I9_WICPI|nr:hypothetical protein WICPIJ_005664 [Wickerhamomyces pijperi]